jgi:hypothetical protein
MNRLLNLAWIRAVPCCVHSWYYFYSDCKWFSNSLADYTFVEFFLGVASFLSFSFSFLQFQNSYSCDLES